MHIEKKHSLSIFFKSGQELIAPLTGKPALACTIFLLATYASLDCPEYAVFLLTFSFLAIRMFPRSIQIAILAIMTIGLASHEIAARQVRHGEQEPPTHNCGVVEAVIPRPSGTAFLIKNTDSRQSRVRITEKRNLTSLPQPGDSICYEASWYPITPPTVPGAFDTKKWLESQGLLAYGKFLHWDSRQGGWIPERSFFRFRMWIKSRFNDYLDASETGLLLGLLAGDRSGIPEALRSDFQRSGLVHVLAISGFHVVLLAGMLMVFLKATGLPHKFVRILAIALLFIYIPVTGGSPAVRRAVLMFSVPQLGALLQRPANKFNSLGVALLCILIPEPGVIWNPGFQLSAAATVGILIGGDFDPLKIIPESIRKNFIWNKLKKFIVDPTYVTLCATLATSPFLVHHFKTLSPVAWLGNIVVVPSISLGMQAGLFALLSPIDFLSQHFCYAASFFLRLAGLLTRILSDSSQASVTVGPFHPTFLLVSGGLFLLFPFFKKNRIARGYCLCSILLFSLFFCYENYHNIASPSWSVTAIDIGQGDSILLTTPSGKQILIDAGPNDRRDSGKDIIVPYLHAIGALRLDALVVTHPDADHFGGVQSILKFFPVKELWISECARIEEKPAWKETLEEALDRGIPVRDIHRGFHWKETLFELTAVHPQQDYCGETNEGSITLRAKGLGHSAVFTGDLTISGEKEIMRTDAFLKSDVLKLGHHGSKTSSSPQFLEAVAPKLAIISSGRKNRFKHPSKQVIQRLDSLKIPYLNTAEKGTIDIVFRSDTMLVNTMLESGF
ncbi:DNA internalization-related competence protein ComEC/Rec2 [Fibrobacter sp. UBA4309]|uniref:DNA internalization-related competence protein ComEC/Rec2 n=1 Tax=Fibrobacter sp. UBA4309 TaxID=1946537 RepID=UPI0025C599A4|nr:DNA internalization-related competence protein ComEC/Rec2 [Fibrobacter sp. UBA4309]